MKKICKVCGLEIKENELLSIMTDASTFSQYYIHANPVICTKVLRSDLARRDEVIRKLKEDGERLFSGLKDFDGTRGWKICKFCHAEMEFVDHSPDCPITLHRALMKELEDK